MTGKADVVVSGSQKGLMLAPGLAFRVGKRKSLEACRSSEAPRFYWTGVK